MAAAEQDPTKPAQAQVPLFEIFRAFFIIGSFSFGGGLLGSIQREFVTLRGWIRDEDFLPGVLMAKVLPGPNMANLAIYIGQMVRGPAGAAVALLGAVVGPFFICIGLAEVYDRLSGFSLFHWALAGMSAAAIGLGLRVAWTSALTCRTWATALIALATVISVGIMRWPMTYVILVLAPISIFVHRPRKGHDA